MLNVEMFTSQLKIRFIGLKNKHKVARINMEAFRSRFKKKNTLA